MTETWLTQAEIDELPEDTRILMVAPLLGGLEREFVIKIRLDCADGNGRGGRVAFLPPEHSMAACFATAWQFYPPIRVEDPSVDPDATRYRRIS